MSQRPVRAGGRRRRTRRDGDCAGDAGGGEARPGAHGPRRKHALRLLRRARPDRLGRRARQFRLHHRAGEIPADRRAGNPLGADAGAAGGLRSLARATAALCRERPAEAVLRRADRARTARARPAAAGHGRHHARPARRGRDHRGQRRHAARAALCRAHQVEGLRAARRRAPPQASGGRRRVRAA